MYNSSPQYVRYVAPMTAVEHRRRRSLRICELTASTSRLKRFKATERLDGLHRSKASERSWASFT